MIRLGFTDDFDVKFVSGTTNLDDFTHCDQVFEVKLTRGGKTSATVKPDASAAKETAATETAAQENAKAEEPDCVFDFEDASYTVAAKGSRDNQLVVTAPAAGSGAMLNPGEKVTVYGAFAEAESQTTDTGLSRVMLVVEAEKINDVCFNSRITEPKVEYWD